MNFFIDQHGCAKNQVDGELLISLLKKKDWNQVFDANEADLIIVNSCGFIESAKTESINAVISARQMYPRAKILLAGCLAERYAADLKDDLTEADGFFGNGDLSQIYKVIEPLMKDEKPVLIPEQKGVCCGDRDLLLSFPGSAFVKITEGCNNRCTFCAIPIIRGELRSRKASEIISEIKSLVKKGVYEINLIGQDLAAYGTGASDDCFGDGRTILSNGTPETNTQKGEVSPSAKSKNIADCQQMPTRRWVKAILSRKNFASKILVHDRMSDATPSAGDTPATPPRSSESGLARLLKMISAIEGAFVIRLLYIHPDHFTKDILPVMQADSRFLHYFDIPFQNGDDTIIKKMNRTGNRQKYKAIIEKIREFFPDAAIRTTFMAGFPGESEEAFQNTKSFLSEIATDWSGCFSYSKEEDTPAFSFKNQIPKKITEKRAAELVELQAKITRERLKNRVGKEYDILIEEVLSESEENPDEGLAIGRAWFQAPEVDGSVVIHYDRSSKSESDAIKSGTLVRVKITSSGDVDLNGDFIAPSPLNEKITISPGISYAQEM